MKILSVLLLTFLSLQSIQTPAAMLGNSSSDGINISAKETSEELAIDISGDVNGVVSLSVFSQMGEIVMTKELTAGVNKISVEQLATGSYIAVVRENDTFRQKLEFQVK